MPSPAGPRPALQAAGAIDARASGSQAPEAPPRCGKSCAHFQVPLEVTHFQRGSPTLPLCLHPQTELEIRETELETCNFFQLALWAPRIAPN